MQILKYREKFQLSLENVAGIFVRHLAVLEYSPYTTNCRFCFRFRS